jgi:hypothetical protein
MSLNFVMEASFDNSYDFRRIKEKEKDMNITKPYITHDEAST